MRLSGSMSGLWKRRMVRLVRHRQLKRSATDRPNLTHRATSRLHSSFDPVSPQTWCGSHVQVCCRACITVNNSSDLHHCFFWVPFARKEASEDGECDGREFPRPNGFARIREHRNSP